MNTPDFELDGNRFNVSNKVSKDVHTEHCCAQYGCKYGEEDTCPVWLGYKKQSFGYWNGETTYPIPEISEEEFEKRRENEV